jgi:AAA family ATP:ADP antiporter
MVIAVSEPPAQPSEPVFGKWRRVFWPIYSYELKKIIPMLVMFFFISLIYSLLRNTKDTLIVTAAGGGAELIPFLKVYGVIPASVLFVFIYAKLSNSISSKNLFVLAIVPFFVFFLIFFLLYQVKDAIEPWALAARLQNHIPRGLMPMVALFRHWVLSLFYIMSELWGSIALSLLFWGFANNITRVEEAKRFYPLFGIGANLALIAVKLANWVIHYLQGLCLNYLAMDPWAAYILILLAVVLVSMSFIIFIFLWMNKVVLTDPRFCPEGAPRAEGPPKSRPKASLVESVSFLWHNKPLKYIAVLVIAYGVAINLIEVTWKSYLGLQYPHPSDYQDYMVNFSMATGFVTVFLMLFVSSNLIRGLGWTVAALVTPVVLLVTGAGFFGFILGHQFFGSWFQVASMTPLGMGVLFGTIQNVMSKASKYSLFDPTKEMAYIPLDMEAKVKGKAAIDVVGARFGKAAGSLLQQVLIGVFGSLQAVTGQIAVLLFGIIGIWIWADLGLGREFARMTGRDQGRGGKGCLRP